MRENVATCLVTDYVVEVFTGYWGRGHTNRDKRSCLLFVDGRKDSYCGPEGGTDDG